MQSTRCLIALDPNKFDAAVWIGHTPKTIRCANTRNSAVVQLSDNPTSICMGQTMGKPVERGSQPTAMWGPHRQSKADPCKRVAAAFRAI